MQHPNRPILALVILAATPVALMVLLQIRGLLKAGELRREFPLPPLTRASHPLIFWSIVSMGVLGVAVTIGVILVAIFWLLAS